MTLIAAIVLFILAYVTHITAQTMKNEKTIRRLMINYARFFGVNVTELQSTKAVPDPVAPYLTQVKIYRYLFLVLSGVLLLTGLFLLFIALGTYAEL